MLGDKTASFGVRIILGICVIINCSKFSFQYVVGLASEEQIELDIFEDDAGSLATLTGDQRRSIIVHLRQNQHLVLKNRLTIHLARATPNFSSKVLEKEQLLAAVTLTDHCGLCMWEVGISSSRVISKKTFTLANFRPTNCRKTNLFSKYALYATHFLAHQNT